MGKQITSEELTALRVYAANAGADWKRDLVRDWLRGGTETIDEHGWSLLYCLRNSHGSAWLDAFDLAPVSADEFVAERKDHDATEYHAPGLRLAVSTRGYGDDARYYTIDSETGEWDNGPFQDLDSAKQAAIAAGGEQS
jgi:hypothetical protein